MKVSTVSGDVKIAIPANLSLEGSNLAQATWNTVLGHLDVETTVITAWNSNYDDQPRTTRSLRS